ncbi:MAG: type II toxin-antitoxin system HicA family toxin [Gammaproteobacteria bacterium]|nr:type II toxin-antitoxin system HicA family toxin [Gammaproteobacteria bacterium]MDD9885025.1 type II toxin-antitoxin system HicA family toxin [Gammaproteobacteria bacterium]
MRRRELIAELERRGCVLARHGAKHDWYRNPASGVYQAVPRHREINQYLAERIIKKLSE